MSKSLKSGIIATCVIFSGGVLHTHGTGSFFPELPFAVAVSSVILYTSLFINRDNVILGVLSFTGLSVLYRAYLYLFPASMLRFDPDAHAVRSQIIVQTGSLGGIVPDFYHNAPVFHILGSVTSLITKLPVNISYVVFPIIVGILMSIFAAVLAKHMIKSTQAVLPAVAIGAVSASTIKYSVGPIPMTLAAMYFAGCIITILLYRRSHNSRYFIIFALFSIAAALTHKIPILFLVAFLSILSAYTVAYKKVSKQSIQLVSPSLLLSAFVLLALQWIYIADFLPTFGRLTGAIIFATGESLVSQPDPAAAIFVDPPLLIKIRNLAYFFVSTGVAAVIGLYLFRHAKNMNVRILQTAALVTVGITLPSLVFGTNPGFKRVFVYGSIFVAVLIAVGATHISNLSIPGAKKTSVVVVLAILIVNPLSVVATPDFPGTHRTYFTQQEVDGKHFMNSKVPEKVHLDMYYGDEVFNFSRAAGGDDRHQRTVPNVEDSSILMSKELTDGTLLEQNYTYIGLRTDIDIYRLKGGRYNLTWDPEQALNQSYQRIYANGGSTVFHRTD